MQQMPTAPFSNEFTTAIGLYDTSGRNEKFRGFLYGENNKCFDSSVNIKRQKIEEYFNLAEPNQMLPIAYTANYAISTKEANRIIAAYKNENIAHNLDINDLFVKVYVPHEPLELLHSLVDMGNYLFKDARSRNHMESRIVNNFIREKSKVLYSKEL